MGFLWYNKKDDGVLKCPECKKKYTQKTEPAEKSGIYDNKCPHCGALLGFSTVSKIINTRVYK